MLRCVPGRLSQLKRLGSSVKVLICGAQASSDQPFDQDPRKSREKADILPLLVCFAYGAPQFALSLMESCTAITLIVYSEVKGMPIGMQAMLRVLLKSIDILLGFVVALASDTITTRWGRRRPFIAVGAPIAAVALILFTSPPESLSLQRGMPIGKMSSAVCTTAVEGHNCSVLAVCVDAAVESGLLPAWYSVGAISSAAAQAGIGLRVWFLATRFFLYCGGQTVIAVPYDALGMELTTNFDQRSRLFGFKGLGALFGSAISVLVSIWLATRYASSLARQASALGLFAAVATSVMVSFHLCIVKEKPTFGNESVPFVSTVRDMFANGPYVNYLLIRFFLTFGNDLLLATMIFFIKYVLAVENTLRIFSYFRFAVLVFSIVHVPLVVRLTLKLGKKETMFLAMSAMSASFFVLYFLDPHWIRDSGFIVTGFPWLVSIGVSMMQSVPGAMLSDIIDYDELHCGTRREGMYVVLETTITQLMDIVASSLPIFLLAALGYANNGGCSCGCGTACPLPFERWRCPGDIGYACSGGLDDQATPFYGAPMRQPPCLNQNAAVKTVLKVFTTVIPAIFFGVSCFVTCYAPIDSAAHKQIKDQMRLRKAGEIVTDPLTGTKLAAPKKVSANRWMQRQLGHFTVSELKMARGDHGIQRLRQKIYRQIAGWVFVAVVLLMMTFLFSGWDHYLSIFSGICILLVASLALMTWELIRLIYGMKNPLVFDYNVPHRESMEEVLAKSRGTLFKRIQLASAAVDSALEAMGGEAKVGKLRRAAAVLQLATQDPGMTTDENGKPALRGEVAIRLGAANVVIRLVADTRAGREDRLSLMEKEPMMSRNSSMVKNTMLTRSWDLTLSRLSTPAVSKPALLWKFAMHSSLRQLNRKFNPRGRVFMMGHKDNVRSSTALPYMPKDAPSESRIRAALQNGAMLRNLSEEQKSRLVGACERVTFKTGDVVIKQGAQVHAIKVLPPIVS